MAKLKVLILICVLHAAIGSPSCETCPDCNCTTAEDLSQKPCPGGKSLYSVNDIIEVIDYIAVKLQLSENIKNNYNKQIENVTDKYHNKILEFHQQIKDRPKHMKHIFEDMDSKRQQIKPMVDMVASKMHDIEIEGAKLDMLEEQAKRLYTKFLRYQDICQTYCGEDLYIESLKYEFHSNYHHGYGYDHDYDPSYPYIYKAMILPTNCPTNKVCWGITDLYHTITDRLSSFNHELGEEIAKTIDDIEATCDDYILAYKDALINAAIKRYGPIMYDILSLQDDYYHLVQFVLEVNKLLQFDYLYENLSRISQLLMILERDVNKYGISCINCQSNVRMKREMLDVNTPDTPDDDAQAVYNKTVDCLINEKIEELRQLVINDTKILEELEKYTNGSNSEAIDAFINKYVMIEEVTRELQIQKDAYIALKSVIPNSHFNKIKELLPRSEKLLKNLEQAKISIDQILNV